ncbi:MAG: glutamate-cysteine ligase family protein [Eubacteriales bacterium]|nr:glutamate-cysteine ligase family protein [Eubacteriales bacterium]
MRKPYNTAAEISARLGRDGLEAAFGGGFGLEKESLRIMKADGRIARTDHPFVDDPHFSRDFAESQLEIITPVADSTEELYRMISQMHTNALQRLAESGETLHTSSNPPAYIPSEVRVAHFEGEDAHKEEYRKYLLEKYGLERMLLSGIHYNFSYSEEYPSFLGTTADALYLNVAACTLHYAWLLVWLTAASPGPCRTETFGQCREGVRPVYASVRCGKEGYWNSFLPVLDFSGVSSYCDSIESYVRDGMLYSSSELYLPVRLKPRGVNTLDGLRKGIDHIELRMLDLNPLEPAGIALEDLRFLRLFLIWCSFFPRHLPDEKEQKDAIANMKQASLFDERGIWIREGSVLMPVREAALEVLSEMACTFEAIGRSDVLSTIEYQKRKLLAPGSRYAEQVDRICANSLPSARITA